MFHKNIKLKEKEKLELIINIINSVMNQQKYESERFIQKKVSKSLIGESINKVRLYFKKDNTNYCISVQIYY